MSPYPHPIIAREGWPFVAIALAATVVLAWLFGTVGGLVGLAALAFVVQFFRDPAREIPMQPGIVLSPADGRIVSVGKTRDPFLDRDALGVEVPWLDGITRVNGPERVPVVPSRVERQPKPRSCERCTGFFGVCPQSTRKGCGCARFPRSLTTRPGLAALCRLISLSILLIRDFFSILGEGRSFWYLRTGA